MISNLTLPEPREELWTLLELRNMVTNKQIDLEPSYQRDVVWTSLKRSYLIDSLRNRFYVPPIITALRETDPGVWKLNVVDGKQRMTAILDYYNNVHPSIPPRVAVTKQNKLYYSKAKSGATVLSKAEREHFDNLKLIVVQYIGLTEFQERELFQRMQMGMTLTPSERMHAIESPMHDFLNDILEQFPILNEVLNQARMKYTQDLAQVLNMIFYNHHSLPGGDSTVKFLNETRPTGKEKDLAIYVFAKFARFLNRYRAVMIDDDLKMSPVEFVFCCKLIQSNKAIAGETFLNTYINTWHHVRKVHPNQVKKNKQVMTTLQEYAYSAIAAEPSVHTRRAQQILNPTHSKRKGVKTESASSSCTSVSSSRPSSRKRSFLEVSTDDEINTRASPRTSSATNALETYFPKGRKIPNGSLAGKSHESKKMQIQKRSPNFFDDDPRQQDGGTIVTVTETIEHTDWENVTNMGTAESAEQTQIAFQTQIAEPLSPSITNAPFSTSSTTHSTTRFNQIQEEQEKMQEQLAAVERLLRGDYLRKRIQDGG